MIKEQVFQTLWARMSARGDFPTLQHTVRDIVHAMQAEQASTAELAAAVLSDFALTQKVIRLANSPMYASFGGDVSTVTQAIMALGVETIGHLAMGLQLVDGFSGLAAGKEDAVAELKLALLAGEFARHGAAGVPEAEAAVVCALMHPVARLLVVFYFPDEWQEIKALKHSTGIDESAACEQVLGVSLEQLASEASAKWGLPAPVAASMQAAPLDSARPLQDHADWLGTLARLAFQVARWVVQARPLEQIQSLAGEFAVQLALDQAQLREACQAVVLLKAKLDSAPGVDGPGRRRVEGKPLDAHKRLDQGLLRVQTLARRAHVSEVLPLVLETMMQSMWFTHCLAFLLHAGHHRFEAKLGFGPELRERLPALGFEQAFAPDVFHLALSQLKTIFIQDAFEAQFTQCLPGWYRAQFPEVQSFLLLPVALRGRGIALLYGDWGRQACYSKPSEAERETLGQLAAQIAASFERQLQALRTPLTQAEREVFWGG